MKHQQMNQNNQDKQNQEPAQCRNCKYNRRNNIKKHAFQLTVLLLIYIAGIFLFQKLYEQLLQKDPNSLILTNDAISAKQVSLFMQQNRNDTSCSVYDLGQMYHEIRDILSMDYAYQFTSVIQEADRDLDTGKPRYTITLPRYQEGDLCVIDNIDLSLMEYGNIYINNVHAKIEPIGIEWGTYYCNRFINSNYNKFCIMKRGNTALYKEGQSLYEDESYIYLQLELFQYEETNADRNIVLILKKSDYDQLNLSESLIGSDTRINISDLEYLLSNSINYIDDSIEIAKKVQDFRPDKMDCLYFSVVSITTTGYGDMLPNSSYARNLVQLEIIFGLLVMGLILSTLWAFIGSLRKQ